MRRGVIYGIIDSGKPAAPALRARRRINGGDMSENIIEVSGLEKSYASVKAVQGIGFTVEKGSLFSFLGVNGAGKSTTINILCSILEKDGGTVRIGGFDLDRERQKIKPLLGVVFQNTVLDDLLTVRDNLTVRASFYGLKGKAWGERLEELSGLLDLHEILKRPFGKLSGGQRRRVDIARALIHKPSLLVLDEPTTGLDPKTRQTVWEIVRRLQREEGMTVFLTTHYMEEADGSDRVVIIDDGKIAAEGAPAVLKNEYSGSKLYVYGDAQGNLARMRAAGFAAEAERGAVVLKTENADEARAALSVFDGEPLDFEYEKGTMDDVFLAVTGKKLHGGNAQ